jgi:hypothetical protein
VILSPSSLSSSITIPHTHYCLPQGLQLAQLTLAHEKEMEVAQERVRALEAAIDALQAQLGASSTGPSSSASTTGPGSSFQDERLQLAAAGAGKAASWWKWW